MSRNPSLSDVRARRAEIAVALRPLQAEDAQLAMIEAALVKLFKVEETASQQPAAGPIVHPAVVVPPRPPAPIPPPAFGTSPPPPPPPRPPTPPAPPAPAVEDEETVADSIKKIMTGRETLEELIILMMGDCNEDSWTAIELQECASEIRGREVPMSSISPTLTKMKDAGILNRVGLRVGLAKRFPKQEEAAE